MAYKIGMSQDINLVLVTLRDAIETRKPVGLLLHSDQGWHYQMKQYQKTLEQHQNTQSMSRKCNCLNKAVMENFFGLLKSDLLYL
ncbi:DDE-type integrase/transposase/recombinase [Neobacillus niacini]|uniref:DDE-type integrase/transposase/recombinase n=1 Tax=Neobacillus niacini TaxID=86668 RepID=UPI00351C21AF